MKSRIPSQEFEDKVQAASYVPGPDPAFVASLQTRIHQCTVEKVGLSVQTRSFNPFRHPALAGIAILVLLALTITLAIGPGQVWAAISGWLGFMPGVGFVKMEHTQVLPAPVTVNWDEYQLTVQDVVAGPESTLVSARISGYPENEIFPVENFWLETQTEGGFRPIEYGAALDWQPGSPPGTHAFRVTLIFPRLPVPAKEVRLKWSPGGAQAGLLYSVILPLQPASMEQFPPAYHPDSAHSQLHKVTYSVEEVSQSPAQTAVRITQMSPDEFNQLYTSEPRGIWLQDEQGRQYSLLEDFFFNHQGQPIVVEHLPDGTYQVLRWTFAFEPVDPNTRNLTLHIEKAWFRAFFDAHYTFELGEDPQIGQVWPLDWTIEVAGMPVKVTQARLEERVDQDDQGRRTVRVLRFDITALPKGYTLDFLYSEGSAYVYDPASDESLTGIVLSAADISSGKVEVHFEYAEGLIHGPWDISWNVPEQ